MNRNLNYCSILLNKIDLAYYDITNRRDQAERLSRDLKKYGHRNEMLSGAVNQNKRTRILESFRAGKLVFLLQQMLQVEEFMLME